MPLSREQFMELRRQGLSPEQIAGFEAGNVPSESTRSTAPAQRTGMASPALAGQFMESIQPPPPLWQQSMSTVGGIAGGLAGPALIGAARGAPLGPWGAFGGGVLGAGMGAAGMEAARQGIAGQDFNPQQMMEQGLLHGVAEGFTRGTMGIGSGLARAMMQTALRPARGMAHLEPEIAKKALASGATVLPVAGRGGYAKAAGKRAASRAEKDAILRKRGAGGPQHNIDLKGLVPKADDFVSSQSPQRSRELGEANRIIKDFLKEHPQPKTPAEADAMKRELQDRVKGLYPKIAKGQQISLTSGEVPLEARVYYGIAQRLRENLERIPGVAKVNRRTQELGNVASTVKEAEAAARSGVGAFIPGTVGRGSVAGLGAAAGFSTGDDGPERWRNAALGALGGSLMSHPALLSRAAHVPNNALIQAILGYAPRAALPFFAAPPDSLTPP